MKLLLIIFLISVQIKAVTFEEEVNGAKPSCINKVYRIKQNMINNPYFRIEEKYITAFICGKFKFYEFSATRYDLSRYRLTQKEFNDLKPYLLLEEK